MQVFSVRDGKVVAREGFLLDRLDRARVGARLDPASSSTRTGATCPARSWSRRRSRTASSWRRGSAPGGGRSSASTCRSAGRSCACSSSSCATRSWPSSWSGSTPASSRRRSCGRCATSLDLEVEPRRIECFDISNIQGSDIVASMVVFEDGLPKKSDYRKFRVKTRVGRPRRLRVDARGGGAALQAPAGGRQGPARPRPDRRRQGAARRPRPRRSTTSAWATSPSPRWPSARS